MYAYLVTIVMADGSKGRHHGIYASGCDAIIAALDQFPAARRVSAMRVGL